jgi:hypothetical protein
VPKPSTLYLVRNDLDETSPDNGGGWEIGDKGGNFPKPKEPVSFWSTCL